MSVRVFALALASTLAAGSLGACSVMQEKTFGESLDEANTGTQIKTKLFASGGPGRFGEVAVEVADRLVLLSGRVPSEADRIEAERVAWSISAVDEVANELVITKRDIGRDVNDRWITEQIRARLVATKEVKGVNYNIQVFEGNVFLLGFAQSDDELRRAAEQAAMVRGVMKVTSYVKVRGRNPQPTYLQTTAPPSPGSALEPAPAIEAPQEMAPIVAPERPPTQRGQYSDPYAGGPAPLTGGAAAGSTSGVSGLESSPLPPARTY